MATISNQHRCGYDARAVAEKSVSIVLALAADCAQLAAIRFADFILSFVPFANGR
jgi:hypothetical protein